MLTKRILTINEAVEYQRREFGRVAFGRDALYAAARAELLPVVRVGTRRIYIPISGLEQLLNGSVMRRRA